MTYLLNRSIAAGVMFSEKAERRRVEKIAKVDAEWSPPAEGDKRVTCPSCGVERFSHKYERVKGSRCAPCSIRAHFAQARAASAVSAAIHRGELRPAIEFACVDCGVLAQEYDHRDYTQPLKVDPVCTRCNSLRGPAAPFNRFHGAAL